MKLTVSNPFDTAYKKLDDVIVFDDIIPPVYQDWLLLCANNPDLAWYRKDKAITDIPDFIDDPRNGFANLHYLYEIEYGDKSHCSTLTNGFMPLALQFREALSAECLLRMRINAVPAMGSNQVQMPHIDSYVPNSWNVIYYLNDTDGDTIIYNERTQDAFEYLAMVSKDTWTEKQRVTPKKGRAVAFKGDLFHSSSYPTKEPRLVVNINVSEKTPTDPRTSYNPNYGNIT